MNDVNRPKSDDLSERDSQSTPQERRRPRFLSDIDRSIVIQRLERGEKQADLAREFGVTRAAISHINKHRDELLTRFDAFARTPHGRVLIENYARPSTELESLVEVRTTAATVLTTRIRDRTTDPRNFRAAVDRLVRLLLEEALVRFGATEEITSQGIERAPVDPPPCAVGLDDEGALMLSLYQEMEPRAVIGSIHGPESHDENGGVRVDLPQSITSASVLLLTPMLVSTSLVCAAVEELGARGKAPSSIGIVCLSCTYEAACDLANRHSDVTIVTAGVNHHHALETKDPLNALVQRYRASTAVSSDQ